MIPLPDRQHAVRIIHEAISSGCGVAKACQEAGIDRRTLRRWTVAGDDQVIADARPEAVRPVPSNRYSDEERARILATCHERRFADVPPSQIVPTLADEGLYQGSEATYYRVLHEADEQHQRGRASAPTSKPLSTHCATGARQLWSWDVTFLASPTRGIYYYLYMIIDIWSRKIVGHEVYASETGELAAQLFDRTVLSEGCRGKGVILHSDNGAPQRSSTLRVKLDQLGIRTSYSRPRVSNDNSYSESLFRTTKYRHDFPTDGFKTIEEARDWVLGFVRWYNTEHRHSAIKFVTPNQRHEGQDVEILAKRKQLYQQARERNPERWSGQTRNWDRPTEVWLNPEKKADKTDEKLKDAAQSNRSTILTTPDSGSTELLFGSVVFPKTPNTRFGVIFHALTGFHRFYSVLLLNSARKQLILRCNSGQYVYTQLVRQHNYVATGGTQDSVLFWSPITPQVLINVCYHICIIYVFSHNLQRIQPAINKYAATRHFYHPIYSAIKRCYNCFDTCTNRNEILSIHR